MNWISVRGSMRKGIWWTLRRGKSAIWACFSAWQEVEKAHDLGSWRRVALILEGSLCRRPRRNRRFIEASTGRPWKRPSPRRIRRCENFTTAPISSRDSGRSRKSVPRNGASPRGASGRKKTGSDGRGGGGARLVPRRGCGRGAPALPDSRDRVCEAIPHPCFRHSCERVCKEILKHFTSSVIPAKAGIQKVYANTGQAGFCGKVLDSRLRGNDGRRGRCVSVFLHALFRRNDRGVGTECLVSRRADAGWKPALPGFLHTLFRGNDERGGDFRGLGFARFAPAGEDAGAPGKARFLHTRFRGNDGSARGAGYSAKRRMTARRTRPRRVSSS